MPDATTQRTCGACRHWHKFPANADNLGAKLGECRESPPGIEIVVVANAQGIPHRVAQMLPEYPIMPDGFRACSRYNEVALTLSVG